MIQSGKVKNVVIFLVLFIMILTINPGNLKTRFVLISFAQETGETGETEEIVETEEAQETPVTEEAADT